MNLALHQSIHNEKKINPNWKGRSSQAGRGKPKCIHWNQTGRSSKEETRISPIERKMKFESHKKRLTWEGVEDEGLFLPVRQ